MLFTNVPAKIIPKEIAYEMYSRFLVVIYKQILRSGEKCKRKFKKTPFVIMNELMELEILLDNVE